MSVAEVSNQPDRQDKPVSDITKQERIDWLDICRFFSIAIVVWLHFGAPGIIDRFFHLFHMPVFFFISGCCFKKTNITFPEYIKKRIKRLIVPYVLLAVLFFLLWNTFYLFVIPERRLDIGRFLYCLFWMNTDTELYIWGGIQWFLPSLFFTEVFYFIIARICERKEIRCIVSTAISIGTAFLCKILPFRLPLGIDISLVAIAFYGIGDYYSKTKWNKTNRKTIIYFLLFAILIAAAGLVQKVNHSINLRTMTLGNPFLFIIGSTAGCFAMACCAKMTERAVRDGWRDRILLLGRNTIIILYIHRLFDGINKTALYLSGVELNGRMQYIYYAIMVFIFFMISVPVINRINKTKIRHIFGIQ